MESLWPVAISLVGAGVVALMGALSVYLARRAQEGAKWALLHRAWVVVSAVVAHVDGKLRPQIARAMTDGSLSASEREHIQAEALRLTREALADQLGALSRAFKLGSSSALDTFLSGLIERAYRALRETIVPASSSGTTSVQASSLTPPPAQPLSPPTSLTRP